MARAIAIPDSEAEAQLLLARFHLGELADPRPMMHALETERYPPHEPLARLYIAIGERDLAIPHALAVYREAWGEGEPYVDRRFLNAALELLATLGVSPPDLPTMRTALPRHCGN